MKKAVQRMSLSPVETRSVLHRLRSLPLLNAWQGKHQQLELEICSKQNYAYRGGRDEFQQRCDSRMIDGQGLVAKLLHLLAGIRDTVTGPGTAVMSVSKG